MKGKGGRPKVLSPRTHLIQARLTTEQFGELVRLEKETGLARSTLVLKRVIEQQDFLITPQALKVLRSVGLEIAKVGTNINQIARYLNSNSGMTLTNDQEKNLASVIAESNTLHEKACSVLNNIYQKVKR